MFSADVDVSIQTENKGTINYSDPSIVLNYGELVVLKSYDLQLISSISNVSMPLSYNRTLRQSLPNFISDSEFYGEIFTFYPTNSLAPGDYIMTVNVSDLVGNIRVDIIVFTIKLPNLGINIIEPAGAVTSSKKFDFVFTTTRPANECRYSFDIAPSSIKYDNMISFFKQGNTYRLDSVVMSDFQKSKNIYILCNETSGIVMPQYVTATINFLNQSPNLIIFANMTYIDDEQSVNVSVRDSLNHDIKCVFTKKSDNSDYKSYGYDSDVYLKNPSVIIPIVSSDDQITTISARCFNRVNLDSKTSINISVVIGLALEISSTQPANGGFIPGTSILFNLTTNKRAQCFRSISGSGPWDFINSADSMTHGEMISGLVSGVNNIYLYCNNSYFEEVSKVVKLNYDSAVPQKPIIRTNDLSCDGMLTTVYFETSEFDRIQGYQFSIKRNSSYVHQNVFSNITGATTQLDVILFLSNGDTLTVEAKSISKTNRESSVAQISQKVNVASCDINRTMQDTTVPVLKMSIFNSNGIAIVNLSCQDLNGCVNYYCLAPYKSSCNNFGIYKSPFNISINKTVYAKAIDPSGNSVVQFKDISFNGSQIFVDTGNSTINETVIVIPINKTTDPNGTVIIDPNDTVIITTIPNSTNITVIDTLPPILTMSVFNSDGIAIVNLSCQDLNGCVNYYCLAPYKSSCNNFGIYKSPFNISINKTVYAKAIDPSGNNVVQFKDISFNGTTVLVGGGNTSFNTTITILPDLETINPNENVTLFPNETAVIVTKQFLNKTNVSQIKDILPPEVRLTFTKMPNGFIGIKLSCFDPSGCSLKYCIDFLGKKCSPNLKYESNLGILARENQSLTINATDNLGNGIIKIFNITNNMNETLIQGGCLGFNCTMGYCKTNSTVNCTINYTNYLNVSLKINETLNTTTGNIKNNISVINISNDSKVKLCSKDLDCSDGFCDISQNPPICEFDMNKDSDGNGIPDWWQLKHFGNVVCADLNFCGSDADPDNDKLTNYDEYNTISQGYSGSGNYGTTDPNLADSDGDGFSDFDEINFGSDPLNPGSYPESNILSWILIIIVFIVVLIAGYFGYIYLQRRLNKKYAKAEGVQSISIISSDNGAGSSDGLKNQTSKNKKDVNDMINVQILARQNEINNLVKKKKEEERIKNVKVFNSFIDKDELRRFEKNTTLSTNKTENIVSKKDEKVEYMDISKLKKDRETSKLTEDIAREVILGENKMTKSSSKNEFSKLDEIIESKNHDNSKSPDEFTNSSLKKVENFNINIKSGKKIKINPVLSKQDNISLSENVLKKNKKSNTEFEKLEKFTRTPQNPKKSDAKPEKKNGSKTNDLDELKKIIKTEITNRGVDVKNENASAATKKSSFVLESLEKKPGDPEKERKTELDKLKAMIKNKESDKDLDK